MPTRLRELPACAARPTVTGGGLLKRKDARLRLLLVAALLALCAHAASAASLTTQTTTAAQVADTHATAPAHEEHGLSQKAVEVGSVFGFPVTNSMVVTWIVALGLIAFAQLATRGMKKVPGGAQNFLEWLVESLYNFLEGLLGPRLTERTFWFFASVFIFILCANWVSLIPGVGVVGWGRATPNGFRIDLPLFRGANADVNQTLAMALIFFACWIVWALREVGPAGFAKELFAPKGETSGPLKIVLGVVFFAVG